MLKTKTKKTYQVQSAVIRLYPVKRKALTLHLSAFFCVVLWPIVFQPRTHTDNSGQKPKRNNLLQQTEGAENTDKIKSIKIRFIGFPSVFSAFSVGKQPFESAFVRLFLCGSVANCFSATDAHGQHRTKSKNEKLLQPTEGAEKFQNRKIEILLSSRVFRGSNLSSDNLPMSTLGRADTS